VHRLDNYKLNVIIYILPALDIILLQNIFLLNLFYHRICDILVYLRCFMCQFALFQSLNCCLFPLNALDWGEGSLDHIGLDWGKSSVLREVRFCRRGEREGSSLDLEM